MKLVVQKYGGTLVETSQNRQIIYRNITLDIAKGNKVIVVVSAMGRMGSPYATDTLLSLTNIFNNDKEVARMATLGEIISSIIISGELANHNINSYAASVLELGIITDNNYMNGEILMTDNTKIKKLLKKHDVIVVPGFCGCNLNNDIVALGRGGSDLTAIILAKMLNIKEVNIYKDVAGVYTTDPSMYKKAKQITTLDYDFMSMMACNGAKILQNTAIEKAKQANIKINVIPLLENKLATTIKHFKKGRNVAVLVNNKNNISTIVVIKTNQFQLYQEIEKLAKKIPSYKFKKISNSILETTCSNDEVELLLDQLYGYFKLT